MYKAPTPMYHSIERNVTRFPQKKRLQGSFELLKMPRSQIFVDTAEKSALNLFCKLLRFKSDTSETSKDVALQTRKILQMFVIFSFQGIISLGLNFVGL